MPELDCDKHGLVEVYHNQSQYQLIQVAEDQFGIGRILILDGVVQLSTYDQHRYHEGLAVVPYLFTPHARRVAILGGGDGFAAALLLRLFPIERLVLVELDPEVVEVAKAFFDFPIDERLEVVHQDAATWVRDTNDKLGGDQFEMILCDYTDPNFEHAAPLYTVEHFGAIKNRLTGGGVFATQMVAPYANPKAAACLVKTAATVFNSGYGTFAYRVHMPAQLPPGQQGFCVATPGQVKMQVPPGLRYLNSYNAQSVFWLDNDEFYTFDGVGVSDQNNLLYASLFMQRYEANLPEWEEEVEDED